jgi:hypothetical protein
VFIQDFEWGFVRTTGTSLFPVVLKTVFEFESYLNGKLSSFAISTNSFSSLKTSASGANLDSGQRAS